MFILFHELFRFELSKTKNVRLAILSDIHEDLPNLQKAMKKIEKKGRHNRRVIVVLEP